MLSFALRALCALGVILALGQPGTGATPEEVRYFSYKAGNFLLSQQDTNPGSPTYGAFHPTVGGAVPMLNQDVATGQIGLGLIAAYGVTGDARYLTGAHRAGDYLARRTGDFAPNDPLFLISLSQTVADYRYRDVAKTHFYDALGAGTYMCRGSTYNTPGYCAYIQSSHAGTDASLETWDLSPMARGALEIDHFLKTVLQEGVQESLDNVYPGKVRYLPGGEVDTTVSRLHDQLALASAVLATKEAGDPDGYVCAGVNGFLPGQNLPQLADDLAGTRIVVSGSTPPQLVPDPLSLGAWPDITTGDIVPPAPPVGDSRATAAAIAALALFESGFLTPPLPPGTVPPDPGTLPPPLALPPGSPLLQTSEVALTAESICAVASIHTIVAPPGSDPPGTKDYSEAIDGGFAFLCRLQLDTGQIVSTIPEPASLALVALGAIGLIWRRRG